MRKTHLSTLKIESENNVLSCKVNTLIELDSAKISILMKKITGVKKIPQKNNNERNRDKKVTSR